MKMLSGQHNNYILKLNLQVTDSRGHILFKKEDASKGRFAFTTEDYDMFEVCFLSREALL